MGNSTSIVGKTEKETLKNELKWMAGWALKMLRILRSQNSMFGTIANHHSLNNSESLDPVTTLDTMTALALGGVKLGDQLELGKYRMPNDPEPCLHQALEHDFRQMGDQGAGIAPIPYSQRTPRAVKPVKEISEEDKNKFKTAFGQLMASSKILNDLIQEHYTGQVHDGPATIDQRVTLALKIKIVDPNDMDVDPVDFGIDQLLKPNSCAEK